MSQVEIVQVESSAALGRFIDYPNKLYKGDPCYVTPLRSERKAFFDTDKNPFYRSARTKLFLAMSGGETVGRIATCINYTHNEYHEETTGFFGFFDCGDDYDVAAKLLKVAMIELKREKMNKMRGPVSFSTNHECGFLVDGFDSPPCIMMTYNRPYLPRLAEKFGLKKAMDLLAFKMYSADPISERITRLVERIQSRHSVSVRSINLKRFDQEVQTIREIYNQAWEHNWGFVPLSEAEFEFIAKDMKQIVDPALVLIAEIGDRPIGFAMSLPDINQALIHLKGRLLPTGLLKLLWHTKISNKVDGLRVATLGVIPEYRKRGIDSLMYHTIHKRAGELGYKWGEFSWVLETNELMAAASEQIGGKLYKRYRLVEMPI